MTLNIVLTSLIVVVTVSVVLWLVIDYKHARAGKKSVLWEKKNRKV